jgi:Kdo2-lipid IVA lauroyltransferase/acyltransferase
MESALNDLSCFLQLPPNVYLSRTLPLVCLRFYIRLLGLLYYGLKSGERRQISDALSNTLDLKTQGGQFYSVVTKTLAGICEHYVEKLYNAYKPLSQNIEFLRRSVTIADNAWLREVYGQGRGCIMVTGHFGAVEFLPLTLSVNGFKVALIVRYKTQHLKEACEAIGRERDAILIDANERGVLQTALSAIGDGRILITQCDEFKHWNICRTKKSTVFGVSIPRDRTLDVLYKRTRVPACLGLMIRNKRGYQLSVVALANGHEEKDLSDCSWRTLEHFILKFPEQWYEWKALSTYIPSLVCQGNANAG